MVVGACGSHHLGAIGAGKLHRQMADTAGTGEDQYPLTALEAAMLKQPLPGGKTGQRQRRPLLQAHPVELDQLTLACHHRLPVATGGKGKTDHAAHPLPLDQRGHTGAQLLYHAGDVITRCPGQLVLVLGRRPAETGAGFGIDGIDPRKADAYPHFAIGWHLIEGRVELEYRGVAEYGNL